jgi:hypothetical protein
MTCSTKLGGKPLAKPPMRIDTSHSSMKLKSNYFLYYFRHLVKYVSQLIGLDEVLVGKIVLIFLKPRSDCKSSI